MIRSEISLPETKESSWCSKSSKKRRDSWKSAHLRRKAAHKGAEVAVAVTAGLA